ncbi:MAG: glycosyltransferase family 2 protein [Pseudomonadota bacterium]|nr:glycosyltransferase family 2 protein [Pseudomonadota bacterium]
MSQVTAILVAYNSAGVIADALASLRRQPEIGEIVVVDNASADGTSDLVRRDFPAVRLIANAKNEGFGRGNNVALQQVATPYALLVNPDAVLEDGAAAALLAAAGRWPEAAILAPMLYEEDGRPHHSYKRGVFAREKSRDRFTVPEGDLCADFLSGAVWLLNMTLMRQVGFFDPNIFLYYEDDDLCLRARQAGYALVLAHAARAVHGKGLSSGRPGRRAEFEKQRLMTWSRLYMERKYGGENAARTLARRLRIAYALKALLYALSCNCRKLNRYRGRLAGISAAAPSGLAA